MRFAFLGLLILLACYECLGDPYKILGVDKNASQATIDKAFAQLLADYPGGLPQEIRDAYLTVGSPDRRRAYDVSVINANHQTDRADTIEQLRVDFQHEYQLDAKDPAARRQNLLKMLRSERAKALAKAEGPEPAPPKLTIPGYGELTPVTNHRNDSPALRVHRSFRDPTNPLRIALELAESRLDKFFADNPSKEDLHELKTTLFANNEGAIPDLTTAYTNRAPVAEHTLAVFETKSAKYLLDSRQYNDEKEFVKLFPKWGPNLTVENVEKWVRDYTKLTGKSANELFQQVAKNPDLAQAEAFSTTLPPHKLVEYIEEHLISDYRDDGGVQWLREKNLARKINKFKPLLQKLLERDSSLAARFKSYDGAIGFLHSTFSQQAFCRWSVARILRGMKISNRSEPRG